MKNYDPSISWGVATIRATLQMLNYKGHIAVKYNTNCKGKDLLTWCPEEDDIDAINQYTENDCNFRFDGDGLYSFELTNDNSDILECECDEYELSEMIVCMAIVDFVPKQSD